MSLRDRLGALLAATPRPQGSVDDREALLMQAAAMVDRRGVIMASLGEAPEAPEEECRPILAELMARDSEWGAVIGEAKRRVGEQLVAVGRLNRNGWTR